MGGDRRHAADGRVQGRHPPQKEGHALHVMLKQQALHLVFLHSSSPSPPSQLRQHVFHKRTFLFLEQLILKHGADVNCTNIRDIHEGEGGEGGRGGASLHQHQGHPRG